MSLFVTVKRRQPRLKYPTFSSKGEGFGDRDTLNPAAWAALHFTHRSIWAARFLQLSFGPGEPPGDDLTFSMNLDQRCGFF